MIRLTLSWPDKILSPNARGHWARKATAVKRARMAARYELYIALNGCTPFEDGPVNVKWTFHPPDKRRRDERNMIASMKAAEDGIADALKIDDRHFRNSHVFADPRPPHGAVEVEISTI